MKILKQTMSNIDPSPIDLNSELVQTPSPAKVEKSRQIINNMVATGQLTPEGEAWLKLNTDPWHDNKTTGFRGVPAKKPNQVVTLSCVQEIAIAKPVALGAGNWSVRISTQPFAQKVNTRQFQMSGNALYADPLSAGTERVQYPVQIDYALDNVPLSNVFSTTTGLEIPEEFVKGPFQVAGMGLEVINTTAVLQQQGLCTCAVMNQADIPPFTVVARSASGATPVQGATYSAYQVKTPPQSLKEMLLLPGTTQWEAKEGAYSVVQLTGLDTPPANNPQYPIFQGQELKNVYPATPAANQTTVNAVQTTPYTFAGFTNATEIPVQWSQQVPMNSTIMIFSGLSDQTTLTARVRWLICRYPNDNEPEILVLAYNSAPWDPVALEIQSRLMNKLPPAVMFKLNPKGEWWKSMIAGIADIASSGLMMMPHPLAKGAGAAIAGARAAFLPNQGQNFRVAKTKTGATPAQRQAITDGKEKKKKKKKNATKKKVLAK